MVWRSLLPFGSDVPRRNRADGVNKEVGGALAHFMSRADRQGGLAGLKQHKGLRMIAEFESAPFRPTQDLQLHSSCQNMQVPGLAIWGRTELRPHPPSPVRPEAETQPCDERPNSRPDAPTHRQTPCSLFRVALAPARRCQREANTFISPNASTLSGPRPTAIATSKPATRTLRWLETARRRHYPLAPASRHVTYCQGQGQIDMRNHGVICPVTRRPHTETGGQARQARQRF